MRAKLKKRRTCKPLREIGMAEAMLKLKMSTHPVMVQFKTNWCGACAAATPELQEASCDLEGEMEVVQVDAEQNSMLASEFGIDAYPTVAVIHRGQVLAKEVGAAKAKDYKHLAEEFLAKGGYVDPWSPTS